MKTELVPLKETIEKFSRVHILRELVNSSLSQRIHNYFPAEKINIVDENPYLQTRGTLTAAEFDRSKKELFITQHRGDFFKRCPGFRPGLTCCNYFVLNLGQQCDMNCSYCYLQSFLNSPLTHVYENIDSAIDELATLYKEHSSQSFRIGTGEVIDSLSIDDLTLYSRKLIEFFRGKDNWRLEFKSKSNKVDQFLDLGPAPNVIVSWSINPQYIVETEEHMTASLESRLQAAEKCLRSGFQIAFHIDPMIWHPEWQENYSLLIDEITSRFKPQDMPYISIGTLRYQPEQRHLMRDRFSMQSWSLRGEMFKSSDGKLRYDKELREQMFNFILQGFRKSSPEWKIFLCMETPETWLKVENKLPQNIEGIQPLFNYRPIKDFQNFKSTT